MVKGVITFLLSSVLLSFPAESSQPAKLHLELSKDTLALAEPVLLTAHITNHFGAELNLYSYNMFGLGDPYHSFSIYLLTPRGQKWYYHGPRLMKFSNLGNMFLLVLPPGLSVSEHMLVWWPFLIPWEYQDALETLPTGEYKLFATCRLPKQKGLEDGILYSDTVEFIFLEPEEENLSGLIKMDSLSHFLNRRDLKKAISLLERIRDSKTPYSEAVGAHLITWSKGYDSFKSEKRRFDELYPQSHLEPYLLIHQLSAARVIDRETEADSLEELCVQALPSNFNLLRIEGKVNVIEVELEGIGK